MQEADMKTFLRKIDIRELITRGASNVAPQSPLHAYLHINSNSGLKTKLSCASIDSLDSIISHTPVQLSHDKRTDSQLKDGVNVINNKPSVAYDNIPDDVSNMSLSVEEMETDELIYRLCCSLYKKALEKTSIQHHNTDASAAISSPPSPTSIPSLSSSSLMSPFVTTATSQSNKPREHGMSAAQIITSYIKEHIRNRFHNVPVNPQHEKNMSKMVAWMPLLHLFDPKTFYALHKAELITSTSSSLSSSSLKMSGHDVASDRELLMSAIPRVICNVTASNPHEASRRLMDELDVEKLPGGNSNHVYRLCHPQFPEKSILLRVYGSGSSEAIDRYRDTAAMKLMSQAALSPAVLHSFKWGRVEEFMSDVYTCTTEMLLTSPALLKEVYQVMHQVHELPFTDFLPETVNKIRYKDYAEYFARVDTPRTLNDPNVHNRNNNNNLDHHNNVKTSANTKHENNNKNNDVNSNNNNEIIIENNNCAMAPSADDETNAQDDKFSAYYKLNALRFTNVLSNDAKRINSLDEIASLASENAHGPNDDSHTKDNDSYAINDILHEQEEYIINNAEYYKDDTESRVMEELCPSSFERAAFRYLRLTSNLIRPEYRSAFDHFVSQAIMELRGWLQERKVPLVFSHNDLNPGNLLLARRKVPKPFRVWRLNPLHDSQSPTASERTLTPSPASRTAQCTDGQEVEIITIGKSNAHSGRCDGIANDNNSNCSSDTKANAQDSDKKVNKNNDSNDKAGENVGNSNINNNKDEDDDDDDEVTPVPSLHSSQLSRKFLTRKGHEKNLVELKGIICIDFEYADVNYRCYDLGNTICELDYDYSKGTEEGEPGFVKFLYTFPPVEYEEK